MTALSALKSLLHYADPVPDALTDSSFVTITCTARSIRAAQALASVGAQRPEADGLEELIALLFSEAELRHKKLLCPIERTYEHRAATALRTLSERAHCGTPTEQQIAKMAHDLAVAERGNVSAVRKADTSFYARQIRRLLPMLSALTPSPPPESQDITPEIPADVAALVIAARIVAFEDQSPEALKRLDQASEAFADRVPWEGCE